MAAFICEGALGQHLTASLTFASSPYFHRLRHSALILEHLSSSLSDGCRHGTAVGGTTGVGQPLLKGGLRPVLSCVWVCVHVNVFMFSRVWKCIGVCRLV